MSLQQKRQPQLDFNNQFKIVKMCLDPYRYAILKILQKRGMTTYTSIRMIIMNHPKYNAKFAYHIRLLNKLKMISNKTTSNNYIITKKGILIVKTIERFSEKFITNENIDLCIATEDNNHNFIRICNRCGYIEKRQNESFK